MYAGGSCTRLPDREKGAILGSSAPKQNSLSQGDVLDKRRYSAKTFAPPSYFSHAMLPSDAMSQELKLLWCYSCDRLTGHEIRYMSELCFVGKLLVCQLCGETIREPVG